MRFSRLLALLVVSGVLFTGVAAARDGQNMAPFDRPLQTRRVALPPLPSAPEEKRELRCFTFAHVMIKEIDAGEVGDEQISFVPIQSPSDRPVCQGKKLANESVIPVDSWSGYFLGVKGDYVFLSAADTVNGGLGFSVYRGADITGVFQDSVLFDHNRLQFQSIAPDDAELKLRYTRVFSGKCSTETDGAACWTQIAEAAHVPATPAPDCAAGYLRVKQQMAAERCATQPQSKRAACIQTEIAQQKSDDASPSVITYVVDASVRPPNQSITPVGAVLSCLPAE